MASEGFHDRDGLIWYDGEMVDWPDASLHVLSHAALCVLRIWGERVYSGNIFKLRQHTERLIKSAEILGFEILYSAMKLMLPVFKHARPTVLLTDTSVRLLYAAAR